MVLNVQTITNGKNPAKSVTISGRELIDPLRGPDGGLDRNAILKIIPYQDPFLFLDQITRLDEDNVEGKFLVPQDMPFLRGHFTHVPVMPGALMAEGVGQASSILVRYHLPDPNSKDIMICRLEDARFKLPAVPGAQLTYRARLDKLNRLLARVRGEIFIDDDRIATFMMAMAIVDREQLIESCRQPG